MTHFKLIEQLECDIRNQVVIDQLKRLNRRHKLMVHIQRNAWRIVIGFSVMFWLTCFALVHAAFAETCPTPGEPCKVITISPQEEKLLMGQNGVLDTAAQARALDLGQFAVYFKTRIAASPQGEVKPVPPAQNNSVPQSSSPDQK